MLKFENRKLLGIVVGILFFIVLVFEFITWKNDKLGILEVSFLNVGQGDATLVSYLGRYQMLIDGGPDGRKLLEELGKQMPVMDKKIEVVVLTHPDLDHLAGLIDVAKKYEIGVFLDNGAKAETEIFEELEEVLAQKSIRREVLIEKSEISFGEQLNFNVFNPVQKDSNNKDRNEDSIVLRMDFGINSFLFMGDASSQIEKEMLAGKANVDVDWLKVGHHGSKNSTSEEFLTATSPKTAVISVGAKNRYKHPAVEVLELLAKTKAVLLRTDELGTVEIFCRVPKEECSVVRKN
jgi:competence protein ComEC